MNVRTMPKTFSRQSKVIVGRAQSSTPTKSSGIANLGYNTTQQARLTRILAEM